MYYVHIFFNTLTDQPIICFLDWLPRQGETFIVAPGIAANTKEEVYTIIKITTTISVNPVYAKMGEDEQLLANKFNIATNIYLSEKQGL